MSTAPLTSAAAGEVVLRPAGAEARARLVAASPRPSVRGKFLFVGDEKLFVRGVTYGTFSPDANGDEVPDLGVVERDFAQMQAHGVNAVRMFTTPPRAVLDAALEHGLRIMVGLCAERNIGFLIDKRDTGEIEELVRAQVRSCSGHPALLCYSIGNEISASIVRWLGRTRVERYLERLYRAAKSEDPDGLVTYANYPSTEYLELPFLDLVSFNVYLESQERFEAYLARLHTLAGDRPLVMGEIGLDSRRHGEDAQARVLEWQVRTAFARGCAGAFVFAWTDHWYTGGADVEDWDFGLTTRERAPKPALEAVRDAFAQIPFPTSLDWPRISVIICSCNGARTLRECCAGVSKLEYPNFEVILVDDGSNDGTPAIGEEFGFRVISTGRQGLGSARNTGLDAATGDIVAYIDDDAYPDPQWLTYLAVAFQTTDHAGMGGPNIAAPNDGWVAACVANAPGGPVHVLLSDTEAEHIPGCNAAFRRERLQAIGGFDRRFRVAGDDVDVCWRLQERGLTVGFSPSAVVWHHRRSSVRAYWKQQRGYGEAEALLEQKWPEKYNVAGHVRWSGRLYGASPLRAIVGRASRVYHGPWGSAGFQSLDPPAQHVAWALPALPEWYLLVAALAALAALGLLWTPLLVLLPLLCLTVVASLGHAWLSSADARLGSTPRSRGHRLRLRALIALLHVLHPAARLWGRLRRGLVPWRRHGGWRPSLPRRRTSATWSERWRSSEERLRSIESLLRRDGFPILQGGSRDRWDLWVRYGPLGSARLIMGVEDHALGMQLVRYRWWPRCASTGVWLAVLLAALGAVAALTGAWAACTVLTAALTLLVLRGALECGAAMRVVAGALENERFVEWPQVSE